MNVWFTADLHLGHKNIMRIAKRPFETVEEHDDALIARWNERAQRGDLTYVVGDFAFGPHDPYLDRLNGQKRLIPGNHDHSGQLKKAKGWSTVDKMLTLNLGGRNIVLCHYGLRVWSRSHYGSLHFYGHSHGSLPGDSQCTDVGVDCWDYQPVSLAEIEARLATLPKRHEPDHHKDNGNAEDKPNG